MKAHVLPPLAEEPRILEDQVHTWEVQNWRSMNKKEHGPIFHAGGNPWYAYCRSKVLCFLTSVLDANHIFSLTGASFCSLQATMWRTIAPSI